MIDWPVFRSISIVAAQFLLLSFVAGAPCTLCPDGSDVGRPEKLINVPGQGIFDCLALHSFVPILFDSEQDECKLAQDLSSLCGCPRQSVNYTGTCDLCPDGTSVMISEIEVDTRLLPTYSFVFGGEAPSCELMEAYLHSISVDSSFCYEVIRSSAEVCGCSPDSLALLDNSTDSMPNSTAQGIGDDDGPTIVNFGANVIYLFGASSEADSKQRIRVARSAAVLSILGSLCVIADCIHKSKLKKNLYNQIMFLMASFDIILSVATLFGNAPISTEDNIDIQGERGNDATCKAQGFFAQLGSITSMFFNVSLSTYFVATIVYSARASRLKKLTKYFLGGPVLMGFVFGFAALPHIKLGVIGCHLNPPVGNNESKQLDIISSSWAPFLGLYLVPISLVLMYTTMAFVIVCWHVQSRQKKSDRWRISRRVLRLQSNQGSGGGSNSNEESSSMGQQWTRMARSNNVSSQLADASSIARNNNKAKLSRGVKLQRQVFWQSTWYLLALYTSWFTFLVVVANVHRSAFWFHELWVFVSFLYPLQGFLNAFIYFRARLAKQIPYYWELLFAMVPITRRRRNDEGNLNNDAERLERISSLKQQLEEEVAEPANELVAENSQQVPSENTEEDAGMEHVATGVVPVVDIAVDEKGSGSNDRFEKVEESESHCIADDDNHDASGISGTAVVSDICADCTGMTQPEARDIGATPIDSATEVGATRESMDGSADV